MSAEMSARWFDLLSMSHMDIVTCTAGGRENGSENETALRNSRGPDPVHMAPPC